MPFPPWPLAAPRAAAGDATAMPNALIVDHDLASREALAALAAAEGFSVTTAGTLGEARAQIDRLRPDVVLVDLRLPDGSGMELLEHVAGPAVMEVVLITGHGTVETAVGGV
jgi:two-component system, NtrC family, response regulator AtoC